MTLRISLRDGETVVINGAVIRSVGRTDLAIESRVSILRGREIMAAEKADTPARRLYHATMMAYLDPERIEQHHGAVIAALREVTEGVREEEGRFALAGFARRAAAANYYRALADCRTLMRLEAQASAASAASASDAAPVGQAA